MRISRQTPDTLVLRSKGWMIFAGLGLLTLSTPLLVWVAYQFGWWEGVVAALIGPVTIFSTYWNQYQNWQLVLESEYGSGTLYSGPWLSRQVPVSFDLAAVKEAETRTEVVWTRRGWFGPREERVHDLVLRFQGNKHRLVVGRGSGSGVSRMAYAINDWLRQARLGSRGRAERRDGMPAKAPDT